ncbi:unnamed protein product, partial [Phaeothamnion confervicola]
VCTEYHCVYRIGEERISTRKHYHARCLHTHTEGQKKGMRIHHHQLEKVKKHQRSHQ